MEVFTSNYHVSRNINYDKPVDVNGFWPFKIYISAFSTWLKVKERVQDLVHSIIIYSDSLKRTSTSPSCRLAFVSIYNHVSPLVWLALGDNHWRRDLKIYGIRNWNIHFKQRSMAFLRKWIINYKVTSSTKWLFFTSSQRCWRRLENLYNNWICF